MFLELLAALLCMGSSDSNTPSHTRPRRDNWEFEEADSMFDNNGDEHLMDDDGYCEDCDDYHDDFDDDCDWED